ncbi:type II toxin-antitoxin system HipA family toxin [Dyella flagellata]|uniref:Toxin HipA n=1 Tax=Dyella flagellata TaxID=1867833 RepID=A0ABQ5X7T0_9GAMM|nr:type II toxin-antitoxin system HipA family toxin [Dyella flagellata]GLQ87685.1 toxin HipA [Dyella flagellata]
MTFSQAWLEAKNHQLEIWAEHLPEPVLVGRLNYEVETGESYFEWSEFARKNQLALSPISMPLTRPIWSTRGADSLPREYLGLPGMLNDTLPDGWGLYLMDKAFARLAIKPQHISPAVRLAYLGNRAWGALTFRPVIADGHDQELTLDALGQDVEAAIEGHVEDVSNELLRAGSSPQGARPKVMVDLSDDLQRARVTVGVPESGFSSWLIKFAARDEPADAPILERAYMDCAREAGLRVMDSMLMDIHGKPAFATRRFDRTPSTRIFCHSLGGLIHFSHRGAGLDYAHIAEVMGELSVPETSYREAYSRAVFNAAMSVRDDHSKNFAFVLDQARQWDLSPAYDLTYMEGPAGHHTMSFAEGTTRDPTRDDLARLAGYYHIASSEAARIVEDVLDVAAQVGTVARGLGASRATVAPVVRRLQEIARPLSRSQGR